MDWKVVATTQHNALLCLPSRVVVTFARGSTVATQCCHCAAELFVYYMSTPARQLASPRATSTFFDSLDYSSACDRFAEHTNSWRVQYNTRLYKSEYSVAIRSLATFTSAFRIDQPLRITHWGMLTYIQELRVAVKINEPIESCARQALYVIRIIYNIILRACPASEIITGWFAFYEAVFLPAVDFCIWSTGVLHRINGKK